MNATPVSADIALGTVVHQYSVLILLLLMSVGWSPDISIIIRKTQLPGESKV